MLKPLNDFILVKEIEELQEKVVKGIIIETTTSEESDTRLKKFEVVEVSDGYVNPHTNTERKINEKIKPGSKVIIDKFSGKKVIYDSTEYILVREAEIQAVEE
ncbi:hypothetical protein [uncultured Clostridium sp.]|uniref:hypothetical protein n=1 Tax=uncultured Clostridium sp. TaxID=59620 RepID=UPI002604B9AA|nr:hypothetical protein [uncultured Clostridium sp.]